jgi:sarcosine oxidase subunit alpha
MSERLPAHPAQRIDRSRPVRFTFAGRTYTGFEGDTIASALYAGGVRTFSRSFKYHRPRGLLCCAGRCANCLVAVDGVPSVRACIEPVREGQRVQGQHAWPSVEHDALAVLDKLHALFPVGFYYKTFIHPRRLWPTYERVLRAFAGLGRIAYPDEPPGSYERAYLFADVAVVGGGLAGMAAAVEATRAGATVVLVDDQPRLGGRWTVGAFAGRQGFQAAQALAAEVGASDRIRVLAPATAFGLYEDDLLGILEARRFVKLRARRVVVATGMHEYPMVFEGNDLPGIMLGSGAQRLVALFGVRPGERAVVAGVDERGVEVALDLQAAGVRVVALADARPRVEGADVEALRAGGTDVLAGHVVVGARGPGRLRRVLLGDARVGSRRELECDVLAVSTGLEPAAALIGQAGGRLVAGRNARLAPGVLPPGLLAAGEVSGATGVDAVVASGRLAGCEAALGLAAAGGLEARARDLRAELERRAAPSDGERVSVAPGDGPKKFVCLCEDVTEKDFRQAVAEGFDHVETLKRYTTVTMGPCQGKMCHRLSVELTARLTGRTVEATGTTARPPAQPVPLGALAARSEDPVKLTPMHDLHVEAGARQMDMGAWKRPFVYTSIEDECRAVHDAVALIDVSTLGKLEVTGRDAAAFLEWLHPNRFTDLKPGRVRYRLMCDDAGIVLDDGIVARLDEHRFLMTTATGTIEAIEQWFEWWLAGTGRCAHVANLTGGYGALNLAGPRARDLLAPLTDADLSPEAFPYMAVRSARVVGVPAVMLRIGFVGELAFEVYFPADYGEHVWGSLMEAGAPFGIRPFGVEAQRVLRLEKQHVIVSQDTDALTSPFGIGLDALVKLDKPDFIGRDALAALRADVAERLVGFEIAGATAPPAEGAAVVRDRRPIGRVTSAKWSPYLGRVIGLAWVPAALAVDGAEFHVRQDGRVVGARVVMQPFYDPEGRRLRS